MSKKASATRPAGFIVLDDADYPLGLRLGDEYPIQGVLDQTGSAHLFETSAAASEAMLRTDQYATLYGKTMPIAEECTVMAVEILRAEA